MTLKIRNLELLAKKSEPLKLALPKKVFKIPFGKREKLFDRDFRVQFSIFYEIGFENWQSA